MTITSNGLETQDLLYKITSHGSQSKPKLKGSGSKGKPTAAEAVAHRKLLKGIEDEKKLAGKLADLMPAVEKEEGVGVGLILQSLADSGGRGYRGPEERSLLPLSWLSWRKSGRQGRADLQERSTIPMTTILM